MALPGLFVVGTDTGVGKTRVAAAVARSVRESGRRVGVLKPLASGAERVGGSWRCEDAEALMAAAGAAEVPLEQVAPLVFEEPLAPSVAARRLGRPLARDEVERRLRSALLWWHGRAEALVVEGVGGLLTPVAEATTVADLAVALDYPLVLVARRGLGTLAQTLAAVEASRRRGLRVAGVVLSSPEPSAGTVAEATNADELARWLDGVAILAELEFLAEPGAVEIALGCIDWYDRMSRPRHAGLWEGGAEAGVEEESP